MFKLNNLYNNADLEIEITYNDVTIVFNISKIVNKRNKDEIDSAKQFQLLHEYLDYKGDGFKTALMNEYIKADEVLFETMGRMEITPLPYELVNGIFDLIDLKDILDFLVNVKKYRSLSSLNEEFDEKLVTDGLGTRVQTYTKGDYLELVALVQVLKTVVGPIGHFNYMNSAELGKELNHYTLYNFIKQHKIYESDPVQKLHGLTAKVIENASKSDDESAVRIIETGLPSEDLETWAISIAMIQKIAMSVIVDDTNDKNVITRTYNFITNKLKVKGDTANAIRSKKPMVDTEGESGDSESRLESYRIVSEFSRGFLMEMEWALNMIVDDPTRLDPNIDMRLIDDAKVFVNKMADITLSPVHITILGWIFKHNVDPRSLKYIKLDTILGMLALAFAYLWQNNFKYLALLMTSVHLDNDDFVTINFTTNRSRITKELKDELDSIFPYMKVIVTAGNLENRLVNIADITINNVADEIYKHRWTFMANDEYIIEATGKSGNNINVPSDLKIKLAELIIFLNK